MSDSVETSVAQVGLRDFLFYVVPGSVLLMAVFALLGLAPSTLASYLGVGSSMAGLLLSYILGQCAYPAAYVVRAAMNSVGALRKLEGEESPEFIAAYQKIADSESAYFAVEVFRYRTLARFCSLMVVPLMFLWFSVAFGNWSVHGVTKRVISLLGALIVGGFLWRYRRYEKRYRKAVVGGFAVPT